MNKWLLNQVLREEAEEHLEGGGGGVAQEVFTDNGNQEPAQHQQQQAQPQAPPTQPSIPLDQLPRLMQAMQPQQQQQQPQLTQEEIDAKLKRVKIDPETAAAFFGEGATEQQIKFLQSFVDRIVEHTNTVNGYALQHMQNRFQEQYSPVQQFIEQQKATMFSSALIEDYPALKGRESLVNHVIQVLRQQGYRAASGEEAARTVAAHVENLMKQVDPSFTLAQQQQNQQPQHQTMPKMAGMPAGAGGPAQPGGGSSKPEWLSVFS